jgi:FMN-dependent NADH-azoreductase
MKGILFVSSSPRGADSYSHQIARGIVEELQREYPAAPVVVRDVASNPLPHVGAAFVTGRVLPAEQRSAAEAEAIAASDVLIDELEAADVAVIAVPMYNFGLPSTLKAWIDHIVRPGRTFSYSKSGPQGLLQDKKVILVLARGGIYSAGPMQQFDFQESYLRTVLAFIGITNVYTVHVEGVALGEEALGKAMDSARKQAAEVVRKIAAAAPEDDLLAAA